MYVEINDPTHCTIIAQPPGQKLAPEANRSRTCPQCQQATWAHTSACMWRGHDTARVKIIWACVAATLIVVSLLARIALTNW